MLYYGNHHIMAQNLLDLCSFESCSFWWYDIKWRSWWVWLLVTRQSTNEGLRLFTDTSAHLSFAFSRSRHSKHNCSVSWTYNTYAKYRSMFIHVLLVHKLITLQKQSSVFCKKNVLNVCNVLSAFYAPKLSAVQWQQFPYTSSFKACLNFRA